MKFPWSKSCIPESPGDPPGGFTLFEMLIAMALTAVIGAVLFRTWDMVALSGRQAQQAVAARERERIVFGIIDNDMAALHIDLDASPPGEKRHTSLGGVSHRNGDGGPGAGRRGKRSPFLCHEGFRPAGSRFHGRGRVLRGVQVAARLAQPEDARPAGKSVLRGFRGVSLAGDRAFSLACDCQIRSCSPWRADGDGMGRGRIGQRECRRIAAGLQDIRNGR